MIDKWKMLKRSPLVTTIIIVCLILAVGFFYGITAFFWHMPEAKETITILTQRLTSKGTSQLELIRENTRLRDNCRWAMILEPIIDPESRATLDAVDEAIRQWKQEKK